MLQKLESFPATKRDMMNLIFLTPSTPLQNVLNPPFQYYRHETTALFPFIVGANPTSHWEFPGSLNLIPSTQIERPT